MTSQAPTIKVLRNLLVLTMAWGLLPGCSEPDTPREADVPAGDKAAGPTGPPETRANRASSPAKQDGVRVPLGEIEVPRGTPDGEWLEIGGHTPLLWCYRGGRRLVFEQEGPKVYLSVDGKPFYLAGIIVRSKQEMLLVDTVAKESDHHLALWVYSPHLTHLGKVASVGSIDSIHVWEWGRGLLTGLSPIAAAKGLTSLCIRDCPELSDLAPLRGSAKLSSLDLRGTGTKGIKQLAGLPLIWLDVRSTQLAPSDALALAEIESLITLKVSAYAANGKAMPLAQTLPKLASLDALTVAHATEGRQEGHPFVPPGAPPKLSVLILDGLGGKPDLSSLTSLKGLTALRISVRMKKLELDLTPLSSLQALQSLRVVARLAHPLETPQDAAPRVYFEKSLDLTPLRKLKRIEILEIVCDGLTVGNESLGRLPALRQLVLQAQGEIDISRFRHPEKLRLVNLSGSTNIPQYGHLLSNLDRLAECKNLESLSLRGCAVQVSVVPDLKPLAALHKLRFLDLGHFNSGGSHLEGLADLKQLQVLNLQGYSGHVPGQKGLAPLASLEQLRELDLSQTRAGRNKPYDLTPIAKLKRLSRLELDLADVKGGSLPSWPSLVSVSLARNITTKALEDFVRQHPRLARLRLRGGGEMFHEPLGADISSVRLLTNLTDLDIECSDLRLFGDMRRLTHVRMRPDLETWGNKRLALDSPAACRMTALRYLQVDGIYRTLRLPSTWSNIFRVHLLPLPGYEANVVGPAGDRGVHLFPGSPSPASTE